MFIIDTKIGKELNKIRDSLLSEYLTHLLKYGNKVTENKRNLAKGAVGCFVLNLHRSVVTSKDFMYTTLHESNFSKGRVVNGKRVNRKVSYTYFRSFLDFMYFEDYIEIEKGRVESYKFEYGKMIPDQTISTKIRFNRKLKQLINDHELQSITIPLDNVIQLRNSDKESVSFKMPDHIKSVRNYLNDFNTLARQTEVCYNDKKFDVQMYKVYNDSSFKKGARSFMSNSIQGLSKEQRKDVVIKGENVCIYDFVAFEPSILYTLQQEEMEGDPYEIELNGYDKAFLRKIVKTAMLMMLHAESEDKAHKAFNYYIAENFDVNKLYLDGTIPTEFIHTRVLFDEIKKKHVYIHSRFFKDEGLEIMYVGSLINDMIVDGMMQKYKVLVLQTHDEFSCAVGYHKELYDMMVYAWEYVLGNSINCKIKREI